MFLRNAILSSLLVMGTLQTADAATFFGHWAAGSFEKAAKEHYRFNQFEFVVSNRKLGKFLMCMKEKHPDSHVFLSGGPGKANPDVNVVSSAFWCDGEINLSSCAPENQRKSCH
jgi:hypothetical protein